MSLQLYGGNPTLKGNKPPLSVRRHDTKTSNTSCFPVRAELCTPSESRQYLSVFNVFCVDDVCIYACCTKAPPKRGSTSKIWCAKRLYLHLCNV